MKADEANRSWQRTAGTIFEGGKYCGLCRRIFDIRSDVERCSNDGSTLSTVRRSPFEGSEVERQFQIVELLGCGGWGLVFKARQVSLDRFVAVKTLHSHLLSRPDLADRFRREAALVSRLSHPNIISTIDYGVLPSGAPYLIMEYLPGLNLDELLESEGRRLSFDEVAQIVDQVCDGLSAAHAQKIIHRDIKPSNIRVSNFGSKNLIVKVMDFGLAKIVEDEGLNAGKLTLTGCTIGTPDYMSPERSDIYSLGCVTYELLTGVPAIHGCNAFDTMQKHLNEMPASFESHGLVLPPAVQSVVMKAMAKAAEDRYSSAAQLREALDSCRGSSVALETVSDVDNRFAQRFPFLALLATVTNYLLALLSHRRHFPDPYRQLGCCSGLAVDGARCLAELFRAYFGDGNAVSREEFVKAVNDIVRLPDILAGQVEFQILDFDVLALSEAAAEVFAEQAARQGISLMTFIEPQAPQLVHGAPAWIRTVLLELIENAMQIAEEGEVVLKVESEDVVGANPQLHFSISCTGKGIRRDALKDIFRPFHRAYFGDQSRVDQVGGLWMCKRIVELMQGQIGVRTTALNTVNFWFTLAFEPAAAKREQTFGGQLSGKRVLVVEPLAATAAVIKDYAQTWGMTCDLVDNLDFAIDRMRASPSPYDVAIVDVTGDQSVLNMSAEVTSKPIFAATPLILMSAAPWKEALGDALPAGFASCLRKPVKRAPLFECLVRLTSLQRSELSLSPDSIEKAARRTAPQPATLKSQILLVEGDITFRQLALLKLRILGLNVHAVSSGLEALEAFGATAYALVLVEPGTPGFDELKVLAEMRKLSAARGTYVPIISMVADASAASRSDCLAKGMDDCINKPLLPNEMRHAIARWLSSARPAIADHAVRSAGLPVPAFEEPDLGLKSEEDETIALLLDFDETMVPKASTEETAPLQIASEDPINLAMLEQAYGQEMTRELLAVFVSTAERLLELMDAARQRQRATALQLLAHQLKGASSAIGASEITRLSTNMEEAAGRLDFLQVRIAYEALNWSARRLMQFVKQNESMRIS